MGFSAMSFTDRHTVNVLLTILVFAVVCGTIYSARRVILIFVFAILFAYLIHPVVKFLERHSLIFKNLRGPVVLEVYVASILLIGVLGYGLAPGVARNAGRLVDEVPILLDGLSSGDIATDLGGKFDWTDAQEVRLKKFLIMHREDIQSLVRGANHYVSNAGEVLLWLILIPLLAIFFLRDGEHIAAFFIGLLFPASRWQEVRRVADALNIMLGRYIKAQVLLCAFSCLFYATILLIFRFPHAIALAMLGGVLEFVPAVGWMSTAGVIIGIGAVNHAHWGLMAACIVIWRIVQNYYNSPRILGQQLEIHPLAAIFAVLVGAELGGIIGIYLAVPLIASLRVIWHMYAGAEGEPNFYEPVSSSGAS